MIIFHDSIKKKLNCYDDMLLFIRNNSLPLVKSILKKSNSDLLCITLSIFDTNTISSNLIFSFNLSLSRMILFLVD